MRGPRNSQGVQAKHRLTRPKKNRDDPGLLADQWLPQRKWWKSTIGLMRSIESGARIVEQVNLPDCITGEETQQRRSWE